MRNREPLVSFTFDDVPDSAFVNGASILDEFGYRGTFYIAAGTCGIQDTLWRVIDRDQVRELHQRGHEIGCHTFSHVNVETLNSEQMDEECRQNSQLFGQLCPDINITNFCFPFGRMTNARKLQLQQKFDTCRGIYEGLNSGTIDLAMLRVVRLYDRMLTDEQLQAVLRDTRDRNAWLIFFTHDVADPPSWIGTSTALMRSAAAAVEASGIRCVTVRNALTEIGYTQPAELANSGRPTQLAAANSTPYGTGTTPDELEKSYT